MINTVKVHGELSSFVDEVTLHVGDPMEAFRALAHQLPGFRDAFLRGNYAAVREDAEGKFILDPEQYFLRSHGTTIHFVPMVEGAGSDSKGTLKTVVGVGLFVGSLFIPGSTMVLGLSLKTTGLMLGGALALAGVSLMLAPQIKVDDSEKQEDQSFLYSGNTATSGQDFAVPVTYGDDRVDPILVASQIVTNQISVGSSGTYNGSGGGGGGGGGGRDPWYNYDQH